MTVPNESPFDLSAWVADEAPALLEAESSEGWAGRKPVTELMAESGPVAAFLSTPGTPPEGLGRGERRTFYDERDATAVEAREAAADAAREHAHLVEMHRIRAAVDAFNAHQLAAKRAKDEAENGPRVPVKGPEQPTDVGRW